MNARLLPLIMLLLGLPFAAAASSSLDLEDDAGALAWRQRDRGFAETGHVDSSVVREAEAAFAAAAERHPDALVPRFKMIEALWFDLEFAAAPNERKPILDRMVALARAVVDDVDRRAGCDDACRAGPIEERARVLHGVDGAAEAHYWAAIAWGSWALNTNQLAAAAAGAPGRIRDHAQLLLALDDRFGDGAGLRILGRLYTAIPKVPLISGWADRKEGIVLLRRAASRFPDEPRNPLFLAEALLKHAPRKHDEAMRLLRNVASRKPAAERVVEESQTLARARELLEESRP